MRKNGCQCPWNFYQISGVLVYVASLLIISFQILPVLPSKPKIGISISLLIVYSITAYYYIKLTISDPTDPLVEIFKGSKDSNFKEEIQRKSSFYCYTCCSPVTSKRCRHCIRCDRCVLIYDHHCRFVNNCIGQLNYMLFIKLIVSLEVLELMISGIACFYVAAEVSRLSVSDISVFILLLKSTVVLVLNSCFICFHIFISRKNITTFEFALEKENRNNEVRPECIEYSLKV